jgi:hypothetical protein
MDQPRRIRISDDAITSRVRAQSAHANRLRERSLIASPPAARPFLAATL